MAEDKQTLVDIRKAIARDTGIAEATVSKFLSALFPEIISGIQTDRIVKISGFGTFRMLTTEPRKSVNVSTGETIIIDGYNKVTFTPDNDLRDRVNRPFAHLQPIVVDANGHPISEQPTRINPLEKLDADASEIKDLLADINGLDLIPESPAEPEPVVAEPVVEPEPVVVSEPVVVEPEAVAEPVVVPEPEPVVVPEPVVEPKPVVEPEPVVAEPEPIQEPQEIEIIIPGKKQKQKKQKKQKHDDSERTYRPWLVALITILVFAVLLIAGYFYMESKIEAWANRLNASPSVWEPRKPQPAPVVVAPEPESVVEVAEPAVAEPVAAKPEVAVEPAPAKPVQAEPAKPVAEQNKSVAKPQPTKVSAPAPTKAEAPAPIAETTAPRQFTEFIATETIQPGSRLVRIAQRHYGERALWVYIYEANKDVIKDPSNVPVGKEIRIPKLPAELSDLSRPEAKALADELQKKYLR